MLGEDDIASLAKSGVSLVYCNTSDATRRVAVCWSPMRYWLRSMSESEVHCPYRQPGETNEVMSWYCFWCRCCTYQVWQPCLDATVWAQSSCCYGHCAGNTCSLFTLPPDTEQAAAAM